MNINEPFFEIIKSIFYAGVPVALVSFLLVLWAIKKDYMEYDEKIESLKKKKKQAKKDNSEFKVNPVHKKWLYFGGGYYGLMAFITYTYIEVLEVGDFFKNYSSFSDLIDQISISAVIGLIVDSFMNIIPAFTWFIYWPKVFTMDNGWYWLFASYFGYQLGGYLAKLHSSKTIFEQNCD